MESLHPCLLAVARGRDAVRQILGDHDAGFYGECYDFAMALKQVTGTGSYVVLRGGNTVYHVLLRVGNMLFDAAGVRTVDEFVARNRDMDVVDASETEIEDLADLENVDWMIARLSRVNQ